MDVRGIHTYCSVISNHKTSHAILSYKKMYLTLSKIKFDQRKQIGKRI